MGRRWRAGTSGTNDGRSQRTRTAAAMSFAWTNGRHDGGSLRSLLALFAGVVKRKGPAHHRFTTRKATQPHWTHGAGTLMGTLLLVT